MNLSEQKTVVDIKTNDNDSQDSQDSQGSQVKQQSVELVTIDLKTTVAESKEAKSDLKQESKMIEFTISTILWLGFLIGIDVFRVSIFYPKFFKDLKANDNIQNTFTNTTETHGSTLQDEEEYKIENYDKLGIFQALIYWKVSTSIVSMVMMLGSIILYLWIRGTCHKDSLCCFCYRQDQNNNYLQASQNLQNPQNPQNPQSPQGPVSQQDLASDAINNCYCGCCQCHCGQPDRANFNNRPNRSDQSRQSSCCCETNEHEIKRRKVLCCQDKEWNEYQWTIYISWAVIVLTFDLVIFILAIVYFPKSFLIPNFVFNILFWFVIAVIVLFLMCGWWIGYIIRQCILFCCVYLCC